MYSKEWQNYTTNELSINLENQLIKNVNTQKLLGIYIDNNLDWKEQVYMQEYKLKIIFIL
jgi:hypothetical protein